jgi:diketogulonate reductase-like aldo/keto reductase
VLPQVLPQHASADGVQAACEGSLRRLGLDRIDLYLLHWRGTVPLAETVRGFEQLQRRGLVHEWGVSNFDLADLRELVAVPGGAACTANQVHYSLSQRGVEWDLLPWQRLQQMPLMAYSPIDQGELADHPALRPVAQRLGVTPSQVALAWVLRQGRQGGVMAIPKAGSSLHLRHNWAAASLTLGPSELAELDESRRVHAIAFGPKRQTDRVKPF